MSPRTIARRYAKALFDLALRRGELERTYTEVEAVLKLYRGSRLLRSLLESPIHRSQQKLGWLRPILAERVSSLLWTFMELLLRRGREALLNETCEAFIDLYDEYQKRIRASVRTAQPLSEATRQTLIKRLGEIFAAAEVRLQEEVDPGLIGGFIVEVGTRAADLSVQGRLLDIRKKLLQA